MKNVVVATLGTAALAASVVIAPAVVGGAVASADPKCTHNWAALGEWNEDARTTHVAATNTCQNMWSVRTQYWTDQVRGQFKQGGVWENSQAGWKWTTTDPDAKKIVYDILDGEPLRAWVRQGPRQNVMIWY